MAVRSWLPLAADGVPTQTNDTSVSRIARSGIVGHGHAARIDHVAHQLLDALFENRRLARADQLELHRIDVDADHAVAVARQARERHRADVTQPKMLMRLRPTGLRDAR